MWLLHIQSDSAVWILSCSPGCISGVFSSLEGSLRCAGCAQYSGSTCQKCSGGFISRSGKCVSCADTSGWVNRGGLTCSQLSTSDCNDVKVKGISSNEACCKCSLACHPTLAALASLRYPTVCSRVCGRKILIGFVIVSMSVLCFWSVADVMLRPEATVEQWPQLRLLTTWSTGRWVNRRAEGFFSELLPFRGLGKSSNLIERTPFGIISHVSLSLVSAHPN
jgi:hypothetical protein